ncbi:hypothetical protein PWR63_04505 [Paraburkholderia sp. A2WS-5]|uniref:hypothetical protein n=1 Tax=Paraburkholderia sp. A2WS-5 TaxID=3028372 RepID=UPI003B78CD3E
MKYVVVLKAVEERTLQQMPINQRYRNTRTKTAGVPMPGHGVKPRTIAEQFGVSTQSAYNCSHPCHESGGCGLKGAHTGGRRSPLGEAQIAAALEVARAEPITYQSDFQVEFS